MESLLHLACRDETTTLPWAGILQYVSCNVCHVPLIEVTVASSVLSDGFAHAQ